MLVGVVAFSVIRVLDPTQGRTMGVLLVGYFFQGLSGRQCLSIELTVHRSWFLHDLLLLVHLRDEVRPL